MSKKPNDKYDKLIKLILFFYGEFFLKFIGIKSKIKTELEREITTLYKKRLHLDFLALLENEIITNLEMQKKKPRKDDLERFREYNVNVEAIYGLPCETYILRYGSRENDIASIESGRSNTFHPTYIYLGDIDYKTYFKNINIKQETYLKTGKINKFTAYEELALLTISAVENFDKKFEALEKISKLVQNSELFDEERIHFFKLTLDFELDVFISQEEKEIIKTEINEDLMENVKMSPKVVAELKEVFQKSNDKEKEILYQKFEMAKEKEIQELKEKSEKEIQELEDKLEKSEKEIQELKEKLKQQ